MPSNKITECVELAPLRKSVETFPCPPLFDISIPGCLWRSSGSEEYPASLISSSEIKVMSAMTFFFGDKSSSGCYKDIRSFKSGVCKNICC
jgi:hypothetical protein